MKYFRPANIFWIAITILPLAGILWGAIGSSSFLIQQSIWQEAIANNYILVVIGFILLQIIQVVVTPINHYAVGLLGGFLFGHFWGAIINWLGRFWGHTLAFLLARHYLKPWLERKLPAKTLEKYNKITNGTYAPVVVSTIYFLPFFPDDEISYLIGISKMSERHFIMANAFGQIGGSIGLAYAGSGIDTKDPFFWFFTLISLLGFPLLWWILRLNNKS